MIHSTRPLRTESGSASEAAWRRLHSRRFEPLFVADWRRALFIHYEVDPEALARTSPFELDLLDGRAFVSLVAFTMENMRPRIGGRFGRWLFRPIATHRFLNVRSYVRHGGETGIHFLAEWLDNPLSVRLGPWSFGLPYRRGRLDYRHDHEAGEAAGSVVCAKDRRRLSYRAEIAGSAFRPCDDFTVDEFLLERYTAFTLHGRTRRFFRIWHPPWLQIKADAEVRDDSLLRERWPWFGEARLIGANYSPGVRDVCMGWPHVLGGGKPRSMRQ